MSSSLGPKAKKAAREQAKKEKREQKQAHARLAKRNERREGGLTKRSINTRPVYERVLIVCEGERTEPNYLRKFPIRAGNVISVEGAGMNTVSLVREAMRLSGQDEFDEVWVVFDRDSFTSESVNAALDLAKKQEMRTAFSNEAFELWYLLHFEYCDAALDRTTYKGRLTKHLGVEYKKNSTEMYDILISLQDDAIANAKKLVAHHDCTPLVDAKPITEVYALVQRLRELAPA